MKLVVGLGNPGKKYNNTRHNIGFMVIDEFVKKHNLSSKEKFNAEYFEHIGNEKIIFLKPLSFMNRSGEVVKKYLDYFDIAVNDLLIIYDDLDMITGKIRLREKGSAGGHNGLKNIIQNVGTEEFKRVKIGIRDENLIKVDASNYVLGKFSKNELMIIDESIETVCKIINQLNKDSFIELQNKYNGGEEV